MKRILVSALAVGAVAVIASVEARAESASAPLVLSSTQLDEVKGGLLFDNTNTVRRVRGNRTVIRNNTANTSASGEGSSAQGGIFVDSRNDQTINQTARNTITITITPLAVE